MREGWHYMGACGEREHEGRLRYDRNTPVKNQKLLNPKIRSSSRSPLPSKSTTLTTGTYKPYCLEINSLFKNCAALGSLGLFFKNCPIIFKKINFRLLVTNSVKNFIILRKVFMNRKEQFTPD